MLGTEGLPQAQHRGPSGSTQRASSRARQSGPPLRLSREGLLSGSVSQVLRFHIGPPLRLDTEGLLPDSSQRASSQARYSASSRAQHRGPPLGLGIKGLLSGYEKRTSSQVQHRGSSQA